MKLQQGYVFLVGLAVAVRRMTLLNWPRHSPGPFIYCKQKRGRHRDGLLVANCPAPQRPTLAGHQILSAFRAWQRPITRGPVLNYLDCCKAATMQTRSARFMSQALGERHHVERQVIVAAHVGQRTLIEQSRRCASSLASGGVLDFNPMLFSPTV